MIKKPKRQYLHAITTSTTTTDTTTTATTITTTATPKHLHLTDKRGHYCINSKMISSPSLISQVPLDG